MVLPAQTGAFCSLALYQPDIPQNTGTILRLGACIGMPIHIIEPCGFVFDDKRLRRSGMDYLEDVALHRHDGWEAFETWRQQHARRLVLLTTRADRSYVGFRFEAGDILLCGRESAGVPDAVHAAADSRLFIPMADGARSLNVAVAAAMVAGEAQRQLGGFPSANKNGLACV